MALKATAFISYRKQIYYSESELNPIGEILEFIWFHEPELARAITRGRVFTIIKPSALCLGMIKVVGKRFSLLTDEEFNRTLESEMFEKSLIKASFEIRNWKLPFSNIPNDLNIANGVELAIKLSHHSPNKIGAVLLDERLNLVSWGWNDHFKNRVLHAEFMLVKNYLSQYNKFIPKNHTLITTLLPCAMCAGYLHGHSDDFSTLKIIYLENDVGPFAQNSILIPESHLRLKSGLNSFPVLQKYEAPNTFR